MKFRECKCFYCNVYGFPLLWKIPKISSLWLEIPKNGSSVIKTTYGIDRKTEYMIKDWHTSPLLPILVVLRDPMERFRSLYAHYFLEHGGRFKFGEPVIGDRNALDPETIDYAMNKLLEMDSFHQVHHFYPQSFFVPKEFRTRIKPMWLHDLSKNLNLPKTNTTVESYTVKFNKQQEERIRDIYKQDYEMLEMWNMI